MGRLIKHFKDGSFLEFDDGRFDRWCIYFQCPNEPRVAIKDVDIFTALEKLARESKPANLYLDFVSIYEQTTASLSKAVLQTISDLSKGHTGHETLSDYIFTSLYAGMIAEENKDGTVLRKRIKRLGLHQLLIEERPPSYAANFSGGKNWPELELECRVRGF